MLGGYSMIDIPNIFLDTTLTYRDPFFKSNFNRNLIKLAEYHGFSLYMSRVVFDETRNKFEENVKLKMKQLDSALEDLDIYHPTKLNATTLNSSKEDFLAKFDAFYKNQITTGIIKIIELDNDLLPTLVERSIKRVKPFGNKKQEFRDAITWLSYAAFAEEHNLSNCFFITENVNDFCLSKGNIHPDLLNDSSKFSHYVSVKELLEKESILEPLIRTIDLVNWVASEEINETYVLRVLKDESQYNNILGNLQMFTYNSKICDFVEDTHINGHVELRTIDIFEVNGEHTSVDVIGDEILINGFAKVNAQLEFGLDNIMRELDNDDYYVVEFKEIELEFEFTFSYNKDRQVQHFEVNDIFINTTIKLEF